MIWHMLTVKYLSQSSNQDGLLWWLSSNLPASAGVSGSIPASKRSPREGNGNRTSILAWENPWGEEPGGPQSIGLQKSCTWFSNSKHTSTPNSHVCVCVCVCVWWECKISSQQISSCSNKVGLTIVSKLHRTPQNIVILCLKVSTFGSTSPIYLHHVPVPDNHYSTVWYD